VGVSRDSPNFLVPLIISGTGEATNFKFCTHILSIDRNKSPLQISGKLAGCVVRTLRIFSAPIYRVHRAVFFAIAQLSCSVYISLVYVVFSTFLPTITDDILSLVVIIIIVIESGSDFLTLFILFLLFLSGRPLEKV